MKEENLIFLISLPRSGSTLTQRLLASHSKICTASEPWIMLQPSYLLKDTGMYSEFSMPLAKKAFNTFLDGLPNKKATFISELNRMYLNLYSYYLDNSKCQFFLDKTPRYHLILDQLISIFPNAKYIYIIRHPLSILGSIISKWPTRSWHQLSNSKCDLLDGIKKSVDIASKRYPNVLSVRYEELVTDPHHAISTIFDHLNLNPEEVLQKFIDIGHSWKLGDEPGVKSYREVDSKSIKKWQNKLSDPQYWRIMYDYTKLIGEESFSKLGYSYSETLSILSDHLPYESIDEVIYNTFSIEQLLNNDKDLIFENIILKEKLSIATREKRRLIEEKRRLIEGKSKLTEKISALKQRKFLFFKI